MPYRITRFHVEMDGWLGDDLCAAAGNNYLVTSDLKAVIAKQGLTGCLFAPMIVTRSETFDELQRSVELPEFSWMKVQGRKGEDDFAIAAGVDGIPTLVVSSRALRCLQTRSLRRCQVTQLQG